ncbi:MAG: mechanosensitive ion channel [Gemmatimonadota bacterium]|nr:mechanosensitive ion channel [Gemmatimonadota bacterium]
MLEFIHSWLFSYGFESETAKNWIAPLFVGLCILALSVIANFVAKRVALRTLKDVIAESRVPWDDAIVKHRVLDRLAHLAPAAVIYLLAESPFAGMTDEARKLYVEIVRDAVWLFVVIIGVGVISALLNAAYSVYQTFEISREVPGKGFVQLLKVLTYFFAGIFVLTIFSDRSPIYFLSGMGVLAAVLMLMFKDTLLGLVAGIKLSMNEMVAVGDWIEMPKNGIDGNVIEVALSVVKVQNWDKTIVTIPAYSLVSESFKNWRGMQESGERRIKWPILIDIQTIKFCDEEMLARFSKIEYIAAFIERKQETDESSPVNGRRLTNVGTFRAYIVAYLRNHPQISQEMTFFVRQLAPGANGLPIEIYVFCNDTAEANYEAIQADIFDHILSVVSEFDLKVFQIPTG